MKNIPEHFKVQFENQHFYATEDPTFVIAEFTSAGHAISAGKPYDQRYISVVTNEGGDIAIMRCQLPMNINMKKIIRWQGLTASYISLISRRTSISITRAKPLSSDGYATDCTADAC